MVDGDAKGRHNGAVPSLANGKICHLELPASDPAASAAFYERVFGWKVHHNGPALAFDDPTDEVSGHWVPHRPPTAPGLLFYIWVDDITAAIDRVLAEGCELVQPVGGDPGELTARFIDPGGNVVGLYQEPQ
jgi:predicted enzyme related to lactoylglutathione lyase